MHRRDGGGARQAHAEGFGDRRHRAGGTHDGATAGGGGEIALDVVDVGLRELARAEPSPEAPAVGARTQSLASIRECQHRSADELDRRNVRRCRAHQQRGHGLVAAADQDHGIHRLRADHFLDVHRHQVAEHHAGGMEEHLAQRNGRKIERQPAGRDDPALDRVHQLGKVTVTVVEPARGLRNADHRPLEQARRIAHRAGERAAQVEREIRVAVVGQPACQAMRRTRAVRRAGVAGSHGPGKGYSR